MRAAALGFLVAVVAVACGGADETRRSEPLTIESRAVGRALESRLVDSGPGRPLLVLLHGRGGSPEDFLAEELYNALERAGGRAPSVLLVDGGDHSYFHDRRDGRWGTYVLREAIPAAVRELRADGARIAIGGFSMGGFGALALGRSRRFCAVGGHAPALWRSGGETPAGAFDDAEDFARNDVFASASAHRRPYGATAVWLDVGRDDPFRAATVALGRLLGSRGQRPILRVWPGGHSHAYMRAHLDEYVAFYAAALARCGR